MHYVALYVLFLILFTQTLRFGQKREVNTLSATAINYVVCAIICVGYFSFLGFPDLRTVGWKIWTAGLGNGLVYFSSLVFILMAYRFVGVGITSASMGISLVIPIVFSWALWGEAMPASRWLAVVLTPFAIVFMRPIQDTRFKLSTKGNFALLACFLCAGGMRTIHKYANVIAGSEPEQLRVYQGMLWVGAAAGSACYVALRRLRYRKPEILLGSVLGFFNVFTLFFTLLALSVVPAVVFFPTSLCSLIILNLFISWMLWKEKLIMRQLFGIALAMAVVILVNLNSG